MRYIVAIVRPERLQAVKEALFRAGVTGMTVSRVSGHGGEHEIVEHQRGTTVLQEFHDKMRVEMAISDSYVESAIEAIQSAARTGKVGDGKIFVHPLERVVRIRTGEENSDALTPVTASEVQSRAKLAAARSA
jgi:nitrogen regulatory protein P-II 1